MSISIIIPTCKEANLIPCLESIRKYTSDEVEVIAVCNGYDGLPPQCKSILHPTKIGYPAACNVGIKAATGDFIVLLNDDTQLLPQEKNQWLNMLQAPFEDEHVGITGPWMMHNTEIHKDFLCFFCCMLRKTMLDKIGLLDEAFGFGYAEDVDLCCRAVASGYRIAQVPDDGKVPYDGRYGIGTFPIYHEGNNTFKNWPDGDQLLARNHGIIRQRYRGVNIENAKKLGEWMSDLELTWLGEKAQKSKVVIELGSWFGKSSTAIADNLPEDGVLYCVDTWAGSAAEKDTNHVQAKDMDGDYAYNEFCTNLWGHIQSGKLKTIRMHGIHAAKLLKEQGVKADLIFIDAGHTYEEVKADIYSYAPLMKEGGIISGHDYGNGEHHFEPWPPVAKAVNEVFGGNFGVVPGTSIWATDCNPAPNIYDCFTFNNEYDILEQRLKTMWNVADRFVISEATVTHSGKPKPLNFHNNTDRFRKYLSKITYIVVEDSPQPNGNTEDSAWAIERHQRDSLMRGLQGCKPNDVIIVSDVDEIPNPEAVQQYRPEMQLNALEMDLFLFDYRVKAVDPWCQARILPYWQVKELTPCGAPVVPAGPRLKNGGQHLSYFGGIEVIQEKIHNTAHREVDIPRFTSREHIQHCIDNGLDLFERDHIKYEVVK